MSFDFNTSFLLLPLFGFIIGLLVSMFGGGGGGLYVPLLTVLFNVPIQVAIATSLASVIPTTIFGAYAHYKQGNVNIQIGLIIGITGILGTLIGVYLSTLIPSLILRKLFGIISILLVIPMLFRKNKKTSVRYHRTNMIYRALVIFGGILTMKRYGSRIAHIIASSNMHADR